MVAKPIFCRMLLTSDFASMSSPETNKTRRPPDWHADVGPLSIYFAGQKLLPAKTRVFVDFIVESFKPQGLAAKFAAS